MPLRLDAYAKPPDDLRNIYKFYQKLDVKALEQDTTLLHVDRPAQETDARLAHTGLLKPPVDLQQVFTSFLGYDLCPERESEGNLCVKEVVDVPGLFIYPSLLPQDVQIELLERILHRHLSNPQHRTNVHLHYDVPSLASIADGDTETKSYFNASVQDIVFTPKESSVHKSFSTRQFLAKKLRWVTLGGQYDWTKKVYPDTEPPKFPHDVKQLVEDIFPLHAEAAIVNFYSPGDTLSLHRDVSEECNRPLVSLSLGCDAIFVVGLESCGGNGSSRSVPIRLRSGDAVLMSGKSRFAWHGVPRVLKATCPEWMQDWPSRRDGHANQYSDWQGWMAGKRININIRQMFEESTGL